jgi:diguanylate cyclase (GGDEF)-like protein
MRRRVPLHWLFPLAGVLLSLGTLGGLLLFQNLRSSAPVSPAWIGAELVSERATYGYLAVSMMTLAIPFGLVLGEKQDRLWQRAITDPSTCLWNRRYFEQRLARELSCAAHCGAPLALLMADIDRLKAINDAWGREAGDRAIKSVAESLRLTCRSRDLAARRGGDEFVVILPGTCVEQALVVADRIRAALRQYDTVSAREPAVTVSIGVTDLACTGSIAPDALFASVDHALYVAKAQGRDRVAVA